MHPRAYDLSPEPTTEPWSTTLVHARSPLPILSEPCTSPSPVLSLPRDWTTDMVRTRGGHRYRPRVRFSTPERERMQAPSGLQMLILRTCLQRHNLHWPQLPYPRSLRLLSPHPGDIRPGWDLKPLLRCLRYEAGGPRPPSEPGHQARGSLRDLSPSRHLLLSMRVHRPSYHRPRGSGAPCSPAIRFWGTWICMPGTSMGSHTMIYRH